MADFLGFLHQQRGQLNPNALINRDLDRELWLALGSGAGIRQGAFTTSCSRIACLWRQFVHSCSSYMSANKHMKLFPCMLAPYGKCMSYTAYATRACLPKQPALERRPVPPT